MLEPIKDLWRAEHIPGTVLSDTQCIGEVHARLFAEEDEVDYLERGGVRYAFGYHVANRNVVHRDNSDVRSPNAFSLLRWCRQSRAALLRVWRGASWILPSLRLGFPGAVPPSARPALHSAGSRGPERVTAMAFHPCRPLLAVAVDEGSHAGQTRVIVFNVAETTSKERLPIFCVLTHAFQKRVEAVAWKPHALDVLAVGCDGGVLIWSIEADGAPDGPLHRDNIIPGHANADPVRPGVFPTTFSPPGAAPPNQLRNRSAGARCLFYAYHARTPVSTLAFSPTAGRLLVAGSRFHVALSLVDVAVPPCESACSVAMPSTLEGGSEQAIFADDDSYVLSLTCGHPSLSLIPVHLSAPHKMKAVRISTPFPVLTAQRAAGVGLHFYFMQVSRVEGLVLCSIDAKAFELRVVAVISTTLVRGVGGLVRCFASSRRRLWIATETGHLVVCSYHRRGCFSVIPVGVAALSATQMTSFPAFSMGSLLAVVEEQDTLHLIPSYHA
eukprot:gene4326-3140_t